MITLEQVKDVPFIIRVQETSAFIREVPYSDQFPKAFRWPLDFDVVANHALHNYYCVSFISCPFRLDFDNLISHFDWICRYLYFNFELSVLRLNIFTRLDQRSLDKNQLEYLIALLIQHPAAYKYNIETADNRQKWALRKRANFMKCQDFQQISQVDQTQRSLLLEHLQILLNKIEVPASQAQQLPDPSNPEKIELPVKKIKREASLYNFLKLNDGLSAQTQKTIIDFLFEMLGPSFRRVYDRKEFTDIFYVESGPDLELLKKSTLDNQSFKVLFQELKKAKILTVSWEVINKKVQVFKPNGESFSSFSECSSGKISPPKRNRIKKDLQALFSLAHKELEPNMRK